jgi:outer membrane protein assembly factor BamA
MPLKEPESTVEVAESSSAPVEPFEPPLQLTVDKSKEGPYRQRWDLERPSISIGLTNDGTFLTNSYLQFSDLLGNQRIQLFIQTVSTFSNLRGTYLNFRRRVNWGASLFDYRDYYVQATVSNSNNRDQTQRITGGDFFVEYPFNRYFRVQGSAGIVDRSQDYLTQNTIPGSPNFGALAVETFEQTFLTFDLDFVGDTTRFQAFGPFQGKRFNIGVLYAPSIAGDIDGNVLQYNLDFRAYKQLTRRSLLAWRLAGFYADGDENVANVYSLGGLNQLHGYDFREFFGTRVAWSNLQLRFPLVDRFETPIIGLRGIRGFLFFDVGAAWFISDVWYDPDLDAYRINPQTGEPIPFSAWDSENDRPQDMRASYGMGLSFFFLGGLQFNFAWADRMPYTQYVPDPLTCPGSACELVPVEGGGQGLQSEFYIVYDW